MLVKNEMLKRLGFREFKSCKILRNKQKKILLPNITGDLGVEMNLILPIFSIAIPKKPKNLQH